MNREQARTLIEQTFTHAFDKGRFRKFTKDLLNRIDESKEGSWNSQYVKDAFKEHVNRYERLGTYTSPDKEKVDVLIVHLTTESKLERARTAIRNFVADHLKTRDEKDAALVAFVSPTEKQWRFSYVKMEYATVEKESGKVGVETRLTPARRFSYIVGEGESCHTAQSRFLQLLENTETDPALADIEEAFSVEAVTKEFFTKYAELFEDIHKALDRLVSKDKTIRDEFTAKGVNTVDFAKKLMGQIVFLYFLQKKGWLGVAKGRNWGTGPRDFLRKLANGAYGRYDNFFNDILEPLFYDTLATDRGHDAWCNRFKCRIPFLNGGLFEPLGDYDWRKADIALPNKLFTNSESVEEGIIGTGVLDVFDRYNFTVNEAEPLEQEVAIDPEMLGKVFENLIEENLRKGLGTYYTPREIVHYMCQESLINYLDTAVNGGARNGTTAAVPRADIETFVHLGEQISHYEAVAANYAIKMPKSIEKHARLIDEKLVSITTCDPAVGSGAFPVGMMTEIVRARSTLTPYFNDIADRSPYHLKRHAVHNSLYGVDIDAGAVEIAKLRLWLSLVVDEEDVQQIRPLPNLDFKVVAGNSLLGFPFQSRGLAEIEQLKEEFFDEPDHDRKATLKQEIERCIGANLATSEKSLGYRVDFDFRLFFSEVFRDRGGFDVVFANPPYGIVFDKHMKNHLMSSYKSFQQNNDTFTAFIERGLKLLSEAGQFAYITPNTYLNGDYFKALRSFLSSEAVIEEITDYKNVHVFDDPTVFVAVLLASRLRPAYPYTVRVRGATTLEDFSLSRFTVREASDAPLKVEDALLERLRHDARFTAIDDLFFVKDVGFNYWTTGRGKKRGQNSIGDRVFYSGVRRHSKDTAFLKGRDIVRWDIRTPTNFLKHDYATKLDATKDTFRFSLDYLSIRPKVIYRQTSGSIIAAIDNDGRYLDKTVHLIVPKEGWGRSAISETVLVGVLNSRLFDYLYRYVSSETGARAFAQVKTTYIKKLMVPRNESKGTRRIQELVDKIVRTRPDRRRALEDELDVAVYALYEVTPEEIAQIETSSENTRSGKSVDDDGT
jgi:type I restriction-modification system DNA methylase subunit